MSRRPTGENATVALFPFLAVLMSTMGSLILLLVLISRQARTQVENERKALAAKAADEQVIAQQRDDLEWANGQLAASREKTAAELAGLRATLAHIEEHSERLRKQLADAQAALRLLESQTASDESARAARKVDLDELRRKIAEKEAELREAEKAGLRPQAYAIVPFDGAGATRRKPIYIECRSDRIVLQPEGIEFREEDFADGQGPANPVAACIRAAAEYSVRMNPSRTGEQPYPLLLVRPDGILAYYAARSAMSTWDEEFGYELIDAEWPLEFPPADPQLAEILARTADDARIRQTLLAKAAPSIRNAPSSATYGVARSGHGIERLDGGGGAGGSGGSRGGWGDSEIRRGGGASGTPGRGSRGTGEYGVAGGAPGGGTFVGGSPGLGAPATGNSAFGSPAAGGPSLGGSSQGGPGLGAPGGTYGAAATGGAGGRNSTASRGTGSGTGSGPGTGSGDSATGGRHAGGDGTARYAGQQPGTGTGGRNASDANSGGGSSGSPSYASGGSSGSGGDGSPFGGSMGGSAASSNSSSSDGAAGGSTSSEPDSALAQADASPNASMVSRSESKPASLVGTRGADWGLPQKGPNATGLSRPIQVYCSNDRIIVFTERGGDKPIVVEGRTEEAIDELVDDVWDQVRSWGSAGRNMYWKPQLTMHVAPDGERRFEELRALLDGSGLDVVGKPIVLATPQTTDRQPRR